MLDVFQPNAAGRSATRRYKTLAKAWRQRAFGRRASLYFWTVFVVLVLAAVEWHLSRGWTFAFGMLSGGLFVGWLTIPEVVMPSHIFNWQLGAWGEQMTASELKRLPREGWVVRHDVAWGERGNHDHVVAGGAVFLVNSRNLPDGVVTIENGSIRIGRIDYPSDGFIADQWIPRVANEARSLKRRLERELGFPVAVYPVIAIWARFEPHNAYVGEVLLVDGHTLVDALKSRPIDLLNDEKRRRVAEWVSSLPCA